MKEWEEKLIEEIEESIINTKPDRYAINGEYSVPLYYVTTIIDAIRELFKEENENENH